MSNPIETIKTDDGYTIEVLPDWYPENPRDDQECTLGIMVCWHRKYTLGDKHEHADPESWQEWADENQILVRIPLYLYDHSGLIMRTTPFSCRWDSGQIGWVYTTTERVKKYFGECPIPSHEKIREYILEEVKAYSTYLSGEYVGFELYDPNGELLDSCWGFSNTSTCISYAKETLKPYQSKNALV